MVTNKLIGTKLLNKIIKIKKQMTVQSSFEKFSRLEVELKIYETIVEKIEINPKKPKIIKKYLFNKF